MIGTEVTFSASWILRERPESVAETTAYQDQDAAQRQDLVGGEVIAAKGHRGEGRNDGHHPRQHHAAHRPDLERIALAAAPDGDERPEADEHAGDLRQRKEQIGVLHVPSPPHIVIEVRMGAT
jgi:hypothetical protein